MCSPKLIACSTASTTSWLVIVVATDQPPQRDSPMQINLAAGGRSAARGRVLDRSGN
jgi:hypothetical protein